MNYAKSPIRRARFAPWLLTIAAATPFLATPAAARGITAGSLVENTATATFQQGATTTTVTSNTVVVRIDELLDVTVASLDGANVPITASGAVLRFQVENTGNGPEAFNLLVDAALAGDDFDPAVVAIVWDSNNNGIYEPGTDLLITPGGATPVMAPDALGTVFVVLEWTTPPADGDLARVRLTATAVTGSGPAGTVFAGEGEGGGDAVVGAQNATGNALGTVFSQTATVTLSKAATIVDPFGGTEAVPGAVVTYQLTAAVNGSAPVSDLVVSDAIPAGTSYVAASLRLNGASLTDAAGDDAGTASPTGIAVDLGTVAAGASHVVTFQVAID